ncbi:hypothetical protein ACOMHN_053104 [Nucella lapillus]
MLSRMNARLVNGSENDEFPVTNPPTKDKVARAIAQLQCGKSAGPDGMPLEVFKAGSQPLIQKFTEFLCMCWEDGCLPQNLKDARIVHLYKGKGDRSRCENYRGISFLSIAGKILSKVILNRLNTHILDETVPENQCGFRQKRGTVDMIFAARQIQEKCKEQNMDLYILFVDLTKAFYTVSRPGLWNITQDGEINQMLSRWHERKASQRQ